MEKELKKYAELLLKKGVNIKPNQPLLIIGPMESIEFTRLLTEIAYQMGVVDIDYIFEDKMLEKITLLRLSEENIMKSILFDRSKIEECCKKNGAVIFLEGSSPDAYEGVPTSKMEAARKIMRISQPTAKEKRSKYEMPWLIAAVATPKWAKTVFPDEEDSLNKLWDAIFKCCLVYENDPISAWDKKISVAEKQKDILNKLHLTELHYENNLGTDLTVTLPEQSIWEGAASYMPKENRQIVVNIPTEEIFTSPDYHGTNGIVYASKPLVYQGNLIDKFNITFKDGKAVEVHAEQGEDLLKSIINNDPQASYLGELALVEYDSPISNSNVLFYTTLYDENAACHIALGDGFPLTIENGETMSKEELMKLGINKSDIHVDFMIGTKDLKITGKDKEGKEYTIFEDGNFKIE